MGTFRWLPGKRVPWAILPTTRHARGDPCLCEAAGGGDDGDSGQAALQVGVPGAPHSPTLTLKSRGNHLHPITQATKPGAQPPHVTAGNGTSFSDSERHRPKRQRPCGSRRVSEAGALRSGRKGVPPAVAMIAEGPSGPGTGCGGRRSRAGGDGRPSDSLWEKAGQCKPCVGLPMASSPCPRALSWAGGTRTPRATRTRGGPLALSARGASEPPPLTAPCPAPSGPAPREAAALPARRGVLVLVPGDQALCPCPGPAQPAGVWGTERQRRADRELEARLPRSPFDGCGARAAHWGRGQRPGTTWGLGPPSRRAALS